MTAHNGEAVDEQALIARAQQGDAQALAAIVENHQRTVYNVALRMCGNPHDAEETLQETFLSAIKALPSSRAFSAIDVAVSHRLERLPDAATTPGRGADDLAGRRRGERDEFDPPKYFVDWSVRPDDVLLDGELRSVMEDAIAQLPEALRIVFIWRDLEGLSTAETAEVLGISEGAVKVRLHRARLQLRELLSHYYAESRAGSRTGGPADAKA